jgi:hypothetical protein
MSYGNQYQNNPYGSAPEQGYGYGGQVSDIDNNAGWLEMGNHLAPSGPVHWERLLMS